MILGVVRSADTKREVCIEEEEEEEGDDVWSNFYLDRAEICSLSCNSSSLCRST